MTLKSLLKSLFSNSKDLELMKLFLSLAMAVKESLRYLYLLLKEYSNEDQRRESLFKIEQLEKDGDDIVRKINKKQAEISITSWVNHEVVSRLAHLMDQILNSSFGVVKILNIYKLQSITVEMISLGEIINSGAMELDAMMHLFCKPRWQKHTDTILDHIAKISRLEGSADTLRAVALGILWNSKNDNDPITHDDLRGLKGCDELIKALETITDNIHHFANNVHQNIS